MAVHCQNVSSVGCEDADWIGLLEDGIQWWASVITAMDFEFRKLSWAAYYLKEHLCNVGNIILGAVTFGTAVDTRAVFVKLIQHFGYFCFVDVLEAAGQCSCVS
jgi:hypothetical protein